MRLLLASVAALLGACTGGSCSPESGAPAGSSAPLGSAAPTGAPSDPSRPRIAVTDREGGTVERGVGEEALYVADEDHRAIRRVPLPVRADAPGTALELPGAPAQVLPLDGRVLVTIRDPSLLLVLASDGRGKLEEKARVELPEDAWGLAVSADERLAVVTSAWSRSVSGIDLDASKKLWSVEVPREPRGVVVKGDGSAAYVTHLVGAALTRLDGLKEIEPRVRAVALPPAPLRAPEGVTLSASLGYAAVLAPDGARLFVGRHALGALGEEAWFGASTIDVLVTADDTPLAPRRHDRLPFLRADKAVDGTELVVPGKPLSPFTQPRALVYRKRTQTILVASEGDDLVAELDATGVDPSRTILRSYALGSGLSAGLPVASVGGAPSGIALSADEGTAWVWCRATYDLIALPLDDFAADGAPAADAKAPVLTTVRLAEDPLDADAAIGRRLFYNATDRVTSGGLACSGCHPEGRDDGHVWHEAKINTKDGTAVNFLGHEANIPKEEGLKGVPRRTPMLAGRVAAHGPYGWHGESRDLPSRLNAGFGLHRWGGMPTLDAASLGARSMRLTMFLRQGLVPPARPERELTEAEARGRELFTSEAVGCAKCHVPATEYTDRASYPMPRVPVRPGFDDEAEREFKTPSLRFVAGRPPYFHDGRAPTLEWIIDNNDDRMGKTNHLSGVDRQALIAFVRTL